MDVIRYEEPLDTKRFRLRSQLKRTQTQIDFHMTTAMKLENEAQDIAKQIAELPSE